MPLNQKHLTLIVEDDEAYCELLRRAFREKRPNCQLEFFLNGQALLDRLDQTSYVLPDLILMDLILPELDGLTALRQVRQNQRLKSIPALTVSISNSPSDIALCYGAGTDSYAVKPARFEELSQLIDMACHCWLETAKHLSGRGQWYLTKCCISDRALTNTCIDFLPLSTPFSVKNWAMLYVYGTKLNEGVYISVN